MRRSRLDITKYVPVALTLVVLGAGLFTVYQAIRQTDGLADRILALSAGLALPDGSISIFYDSDTPEDDEIYLPDLVNENHSEDSEPVENAEDLLPSSSPPAASSSQAVPAVQTQPGAGTVQKPANAGSILRENLHLDSAGSSLYLPFKNGLVKNSTKLSSSDISDIMQKEIAFRIYKNNKPQVLILHTHATESFEPGTEYFDKDYNSRNRDDTQNIVSVGAIIASELEAAGIATLHDATQHDYPSYNGSYDRSAKTIQSYLKQYPTIKVVLDIHRDAIERDGNRLSAVTRIDGKDAAQVMIISGCDDGTMNYPGWKSNLRFAARLQNEMETLFPGLTRPVMFCYRRYNQNLSSGALLIEIGSHGNTLAEAQYSGELVGKSLVSLFNQYLGK